MKFVRHAAIKLIISGKMKILNKKKLLKMYVPIIQILIFNFNYFPIKKVFSLFSIKRRRTEPYFKKKSLKKYRNYILETNNKHFTLNHIFSTKTN